MRMLGKLFEIFGSLHRPKNLPWKITVHFESNSPCFGGLNKFTGEAESINMEFTCLLYDPD
jgi:hypothetical protein